MSRDILEGRDFFQLVVDALVGFVPPRLSGFSWRATSRNLKVWFGDEDRQHYEVQLISAPALRDAGRRRRAAPALEIGFHAEHSDARRNQAVLDRLLSREPVWRRALGNDPEAGSYVGRQTAWRRVSELWEGDDLLEPEAAVDAADRLSTYINAFQPLLTDGDRA